ncbi:hypothetical protein [Mesorhizobium amorphae]|uniref:hypothetical protein n=1 Tax=Mesorhizobium amorphae TaxID=71433 RepID=UPI00177C35DA|nr:hypothetical protein [Mesorhizobium amorphae]
MDETTIVPPSANLIAIGRTWVMGFHHPNHSLVRHSNPTNGASKRRAATKTTMGFLVGSGLNLGIAEDLAMDMSGSFPCWKPAR